MTEPRTEAGKRLLDGGIRDLVRTIRAATGVPDSQTVPNATREHFLAAILAIEAEAALTDERVEAFERDFGVPHPSRRAALLVPALDRETIARFIGKSGWRKSWDGCLSEADALIEALGAEAAQPVPALDALRAGFIDAERVADELSKVLVLIDEVRLTELAADTVWADGFRQGHRAAKEAVERRLGAILAALREGVSDDSA